MKNMNNHIESRIYIHIRGDQYNRISATYRITDKILQLPWITIVPTPVNIDV